MLSNQLSPDIIRLLQTTETAKRNVERLLKEQEAVLTELRGRHRIAEANQQLILQFIRQQYQIESLDQIQEDGAIIRHQSPQPPQPLTADSTAPVTDLSQIVQVP